ncbi:transcriptional regulator, PadR family [Arthrobacter alpinus]|uniref:Transcriptional regulator, PadR family n=1 Tax=Arthrobacter alpinus TaxID=656366 RepID=A0A1H5GEK7_9MICC|nr:PadR family transcriptional regulator [Arthrobacter alpinus]SEE13578.1 transcriptional regulator, PadR family [Arthrobacter alpinus]
MDKPSEPHDPQLLRGVLPMLILALLGERESYGYDLVERLRDLGLADLATGAVYPVLSRFERDGLLSSYTQKSQSGPARKYYLLTEQGQLARADAARRWRDIADVAERGLSPAIHTSEQPTDRSKP